MIFRLTQAGEDAFSRSERAEVLSDGGEVMSHAGVKTLASRFSGKFISTVTIGGVGTEPEFRRAGCVRRIFDEVLRLSPERGWAVSMLHPFSFSYYRMFGYERICDHLILELPISKLDLFPRENNLKPLDGEKRLDDALFIYEKFSENRNIMFRRYDGAHFPRENDLGKRATYIWYEASGSPASYITLGVEKSFYVNHSVSVNLNVYEMAFTSVPSLCALFGFIRMFEGENDTVKIHNCAMSPEIDLALGHYTHIKYTTVPDIAARILDVKAVLEANDYPEQQGGFTLRVDDTLEFTRGVYRVEYENGRAGVTKLPDTESCDISAAMPALTRLLYGLDGADARAAAYLPGVKLYNDCEGFFRAFKKRPNGLFEHF